VEIFVRRGKRLVQLTEPGQVVVQVIERLLGEVDNLRRVGEEFADQEVGRLTVATTHTQARYALPPVVQEFRQRFPRVNLSLHQGNPTQIAEMVIAGQADIAIATEALDRFGELLTLPGYTWHHSVVVPENHPLLANPKLCLEELARYPIITYSSAFTGRSHIDQAFAAQGLNMEVVLTAIDADVIKTYVELGLGVGIIASMAFNASRDRGLCALDAGHLFEPSVTRIAVRRTAYLRGYVYDFIHLFAPHLDRAAVDAARGQVPETAAA
jgi:LysR family cys regulon transcriptional activator